MNRERVRHFVKTYVDWRGIVLGFVIIFALTMSGFAQKFYSGTLFVSAFDAGISIIEKCTDERNATVCARPAVQQLLDLKSGADVMSALEARLAPQQCHYIGHVVGQQSFSKFQDIETAITQCNRSCDSACFHGAVGQGFAAALGFDSSDDDQSFDLKHLNADDIRAVGKKLCTSSSACHGVGHTLFQIFGTFEPGLATCDAITKAGSFRDACYNGMFMEFADIMSSREMRPTIGVAYPTPETLTLHCTKWSDLKQRHSCFRYFPRVVTETLKESGLSYGESIIRLREMCASISRDDDRIACFIGIGSHASFSVVTDPVRAVKTCETLPALEHQAACNIGQISVATQDRQEKVMAYCAAVQGELLQKSCFQAVFYYLGRLNTPMLEVISQCKDNTACLEASKDSTSDPLDLIMKNFGS